ncbi:HD-domain/PDEase-like protein [Rozella allomycis CSF55]|uniref:HD-domain/PDEase-like protein n=1 Tax=Rozella allomycis (strain CSF55) TaxID=988480 RepID=A0A4P9YQX8_ROZAC|nr:HD-domain/PDEase-like protein [Rozella allomycis CSF55]
MKSRDLFLSLKIDPLKFAEYLTAIEINYHSENPYHNAFHGADVLQAAYSLSHHEKIKGILSDFDILCLYVACLVHDVDHPGLNNNFLIASKSELAILYNDKSVLESHHASVAFRLLGKHNFLGNISDTKVQKFRSTVVDLVLTTDFAMHFLVVSNFKAKIPQIQTMKDDNDELHLLIMKMMIKCGDVSNPSRTNEISIQWANLVTEEFFRQGDLEKSLKMPVSPLMDRESTPLYKSQIGFIEYVCKPLFQAFNEVFNIPDIVSNLNSNHEYWASKSKKKFKSAVLKVEAVNTLSRRASTAT